MCFVVWSQGGGGVLGQLQAGVRRSIDAASMASVLLSGSPGASDGSPASVTAHLEKQLLSALLLESAADYVFW